MPNRVFLKDYNYETPSLAVTGSADVDPSGRGDVYYYGENFKNSTEGNRLARIRSEEILCRKEQYIGESTVLPPEGMRSRPRARLNRDQCDRKSRRTATVAPLQH